MITIKIFKHRRNDRIDMVSFIFLLELFYYFSFIGAEMKDSIEHLRTRQRLQSIHCFGIDCFGFEMVMRSFQLEVVSGHFVIPTWYPLLSFTWNSISVEARCCVFLGNWVTYRGHLSRYFWWLTIINQPSRLRCFAYELLSIYIVSEHLRETRACKVPGFHS